MNAKRTILLLSLAFLAPASASAQVARISFITAAQTVSPGAVSEQITIEAQDAAGSPVNGSTLCIEVTSSSQTGGFSTNASTWEGEPAGVLLLTLSSNQYRRNVFFKDSTAGTYTLTARAAMRPADTTCPNWSSENAAWSATQAIIIGSSEQAPSAQTQTQTQESASTTQVSTSIYVPAYTARIQAVGSAVAGADVRFSGSLFGTKGEPLLANVRYMWNFGDGAVVEGKDVFHSYAYPGTYIVSLTAAYQYASAHARHTVAVQVPEVELLAEGDGSLTVANRSKSELNIGLWSLRGAGMFIVPEDTYVVAGGGVRFSSEVLGFAGDRSSTLYFPNGTLATGAGLSARSPLRGEAVAPSDMQTAYIPVQAAPLIDIPEGIDIYAPALEQDEEGEVLGAAAERGGSFFWPSLALLGGVIAAGALGAHYARRLVPETPQPEEEFELE